MDLKRIICAGAICFVGSAASGQLLNASFETPGAGQPDIFADWNEFNNAAGNIQQSSIAPSDGTFHMDVSGPDNQDGMGNLQQGDTVLVSTPLPAAPGQLWASSFDVTTPSIDPSTGALIVNALQFLDAGNTVIQDTSSVLFDNEMTLDTYAPLVIEGSAPTGTVAVQMVIVHVQLAEAGRGGSMYVDNGSLQLTASGTLINGSFEVRGADPLEGWEEFDNDSGCCDNVSAQSEAAEAGTFGLKIFAPFNDAVRTDNYVYQDLATFSGRLVEINVNARNPSFDAIAGTNVGFLEIEFFGADGITPVGAPTRLPTLDVVSALDLWTPFTHSAVTPSGAFTVRCKIGYEGDDAFSGGAIHYDNAQLLVNGADLTVNGDFEGPAGAAVFDSWIEYGNAIPNIAQATGFIVDGANSCKIFQQFTSAFNDSGIYQDLSANPGEEWTASVQGGTPFDDPIDGANIGYIALEFVDIGGNLIQSTSAPTVDFFSPLDLYEPYSVTDTAPAGTAFARINLGLAGDDLDSPGSIFYDAATLTGGGGNEPEFCLADVTTSNTNPGDAGFGDPDGTVNGADLAYYVEQFLDGNAAVADVTTSNTNPGDAGFGVPDGTVNGADLAYYVEQFLLGASGAGCPS